MLGLLAERLSLSLQCSGLKRNVAKLNSNVTKILGIEIYHLKFGKKKTLTIETLLY